MPDEVQKVTAKRGWPDWTDGWLAAYRNSDNIRAACQAVKISRQTLYRTKKRLATFAEAVEDAHEDALDVLEAEGRRRALTNSDLLLMFFLKAGRPEKYRERHEVTGTGGGPVVLKVVYENKRPVEPDDPSA